MVDQSTVLAGHLATRLESLRPEMERVAGQDVTGLAEDCVQEAIIRAYQKVDQFSGIDDPQFRSWLRGDCVDSADSIVKKFRGWFRTIIRNECIAQLRKPRFEISPMNDWSPAASGTPLPAKAREEEERQHLVLLLSKLTDPEREAVLLRDCEGWPVKDIAEQMERTTAAVAGLIKRGRAKLRSWTSESEWSQLLNRR